MMTPEELFAENEKLVYFVYNKHFNSSENHLYKEDLLQEGRLYLWKACLLFDDSKNLKFSTFAVTIIYNRMLDYVSRKLSKHSHNISLETNVLQDKEGNTSTLQEYLPAKEEYDDIDLKIIFWECFETLSNRDRTIILLLYKGYKQNQIAKKMKLSQAQISRILKKFKFKMRNQLKEK